MRVLLGVIERGSPHPIPQGMTAGSCFTPEGGDCAQGSPCHGRWELCLRAVIGLQRSMLQCQERPTVPGGWDRDEDKTLFLPQRAAQLDCAY